MTTFLLAFVALFSIVESDVGDLHLFPAPPAMLDPRVRGQVARWVAIYAFCIVSATFRSMSAPMS